MVYPVGGKVASASRANHKQRSPATLLSGSCLVDKKTQMFATSLRLIKQNVQII